MHGCFAWEGASLRGSAGRDSDRSPEGPPPAEDGTPLHTPPRIWGLNPIVRRHGGHAELPVRQSAAHGVRLVRGRRSPGRSGRATTAPRTVPGSAPPTSRSLRRRSAARACGSRWERSPRTTARPVRGVGERSVRCSPFTATVALPRSTTSCPRDGPLARVRRERRVGGRPRTSCAALSRSGPECSSTITPIDSATVTDSMVTVKL